MKPGDKKFMCKKELKSFGSDTKLFNDCCGE